jgi:hypothetical protein
MLLEGISLVGEKPLCSFATLAAMGRTGDVTCVREMKLGVFFFFCKLGVIWVDFRTCVGQDLLT